MMLLVNLTGCVVKKEIILMSDKGPFILAEDIDVKVGYEKDGVIEWSTESVHITRGMTIMYYDWSKKVEAK